MELQKYVLTDENMIYLTETIKYRIFPHNDGFGFWKFKNSDACFVKIIKTGNDYKQIRSKNE